jgi:hypothetical protein
LSPSTTSPQNDENQNQDTPVSCLRSNAKLMK